MHNVKTKWVLNQRYIISNTNVEVRIMSDLTLIFNGSASFSGGTLGSGDRIRVEAWGEAKPDCNESRYSDPETLFSA
jgi:hypothetical protein